MKLQIQKGATSKSVDIFIGDSAVTTGAGKTGLTNASITAYYHRAGAAPVVHTPASVTVTGAWTSGGFVELDATNMPGMYRLDLLNAVLATGVDEATVMVKGTGCVPCPLEIQLVSYNPNDAQRLGLTALPAVDIGTSGCILTAGTSNLQINAVSGRASANVQQWLGTTAVLVSGLPSVDATTAGASVTNATRDAILAAVVDDSALASAAALTTQVTLRQALSLCVAFACGRSSNSGQTFSTIDNAKTRIVGTATANNRTAIAATPSG